MSRIDETILRQIRFEIDPRVGDHANLQHLVHFIEGYRSRALGESDCPYSPGSARSLSWIRGWTMSGIDQRADRIPRRRLRRRKRS